jgi:diaminopimelate decarboxylase
MADQFSYENKEMFCEDVKVTDIVRDVGTPAYIYSKASFVNAFREFDTAFSSVDHLVCYSLKANTNLNVCRIFYDAGSGIDCNSGGEFFRAMKAGVDPHRIVFTGVGKRHRRRIERQSSRWHPRQPRRRCENASLHFHRIV